MSLKLQEIRYHINMLVKFYEPIQALANSHAVSFFTDNSWEKVVPQLIRSELKNAESINAFVEKYSEIVSNSCPLEFAQNKPFLSQFLSSILSLSIINNNGNFSKAIVNTENLETLLATQGCSVGCNFKLNLFMSDKKLHEVREVSKLTAALSILKKSSHVLDIGSGKGYLSSILVLHHACKVLGLDASQMKTCGAMKAFEKMAEQWSERIFKEDENNCKSNRRNLMKTNYKLHNAFVTPQTDVKNILEEHFNEAIKGITLTGLHTCGDLAPTCMKMFLANKEINSLVNVGCCYHLIGEGKSSEENGFPMSEFLKEKNFVLGRNARMLASHSLDRMSSRVQLDEESLTSIFYRAILETIVRGQIGTSSPKTVRRLSRKCENFHEYLVKAVKKLNLDLEVTEEYSSKVYETFADRKPEITAFFLLRVSLAPVIESIILLDRLLFLLENGITQAYLVRLFNLELSPRGFGIVAWKGD